MVAKGWSSYLGTVFGFSGGGVVAIGPLNFDWGGALLIVAIVTTLLALGTKLSANVSAVITAIKVAVVALVVIVGGVLRQGGQLLPPVHPPRVGERREFVRTGVDQSVFSLLTGAESSHYGLYGVLAGASIVFFAFIGFDVVATTAEETKNPQRDVARGGILASLAIVTVLYVSVSIVLSGMVRFSDLRDEAGHGHANLATAFSLNGVDWAAKVISIGALAGLTTVVMVLILGAVAGVVRDGS